MNINFELYKIFYTVVKCSNITKAAEELYISQPAVSKSIKKLEDSLGGKLFNRTKKGVMLTEEGKEFYGYVKTAMENFSNAENRFNDLINLETGTIRIGISATLTKYFFIPYLEEFHKLHPNIDIKIYTEVTKILYKKLKDGIIDIVILNLPFMYEDDKEVTINKIKEVQDAFYVSKSFKELENKKLSLKDIKDYKFLFQGTGSNTRTFLDNYLKENNIKIKPYMELNSYSLVNYLTKAGLGIGYLTIDFTDEKELIKLNIKEKIPKRSIGIMYSNKNLPSFATKEMINIILNNVKR